MTRERFSKAKVLSAMVILCIALACSSSKKDTKVEDNIKMFTHVWDEIMNKRNLNMFNESNYTKNIILHARPPVAGIDRAR